MSNGIVIIGSGFAARQLVKNIRKQDATIPLTLIAADSMDEYNKPDLSHVISQGQRADDLTRQTAGEFAEQFNLHLFPQTWVTDIGNGKQLIFVETPMLHWPDSMMTYLTGDAVLFSNDAFGQHYCDEHLFNDEVDQTELFEQCQRYYANILTPFSRLVTPKITEILGFNLPVDMIATSHGVVWRDNPTQIVELYLKWAADYQEDRITIFYDTMSNNTRMMADAIAQGIAETDPRVAVKIFNVARSDKNEILTNVFRLSLIHI